MHYSQLLLILHNKAIIREGFKKNIYGKFRTRGGGQRGSFSISNFFIFLLQMV